jgi:hypothetical protein
LLKKIVLKVNPAGLAPTAPPEPLAADYLFMLNVAIFFLTLFSYGDGADIDDICL